MTKQLLFVTVIAGAFALGATNARAETETEAQNTNSVDQQEEGSRPPRHHRGPRLTEEQKACLEKILGKRGEGERPSREKMRAAMQSCGVKPPRAAAAPAARPLRVRKTRPKNNDS